jgi:hypothetical protein
VSSAHARSNTLCVVLGVFAVAACGGNGGDAPVSAVIAVPRAASASVPPGSALSFEATCANASGPVTHAWAFPGGVPASSASAIAGAVSFPVAGTYSVTYQCTDGRTSSTATRTVEVGPPPPSALQFDVQYLATVGADVQSAVGAAVAKLQGAILGPAPGLDGAEPPRADCGNVPLTTHAGSFLLLVTVEPLDGYGGIVALSGPCYVRGADAMPFVGLVKLDSYDLATLVATGRLGAVVLHEVLHTLGYGSLWDLSGAPQYLSGKGGPDRSHRDP